MGSSVSYRDIPALLARHDSLVLPSSSKVRGLVVNEALAAGVNAVVSRDAGGAKSVASMQGVFLCDPIERGLAAALYASRRSWGGAIESPAIREHTPAEFAEIFMAATDRGERRQAINTDVAPPNRETVLHSACRFD